MIRKRPLRHSYAHTNIRHMERQGILQNRHTEGLHLHPTHPQDHWPHQTESGAYFVHTSG